VKPRKHGRPVFFDEIRWRSSAASQSSFRGSATSSCATSATPRAIQDGRGDRHHRTSGGDLSRQSEAESHSTQRPRCIERWYANPAASRALLRKRSCRTRSLTDSPRSSAKRIFVEKTVDHVLGFTLVQARRSKRASASSALVTVRECLSRLRRRVHRSRQLREFEMRLSLALFAWRLLPQSRTDCWLKPSTRALTAASASHRSMFFQYLAEQFGRQGFLFN